MDAQMPCLQILEYKEFWQPQAEITLFDVCIIDIDVQSHVQHSVVLYCLWQNKQRNMQEQLKHVFTPFISICWWSHGSWDKDVSNILSLENSEQMGQSIEWGDEQFRVGEILRFAIVLSNKFVPERFPYQWRSRIGLDAGAGHICLLNLEFGGTIDMCIMLPAFCLGLNYNFILFSY